MLENFQVGISDLTQIFILSVVVYTLIHYVKDTRTGQVLMGFIRFVVPPAVLIWLFNWDVLGRIFFWTIVALIISMIVVFQEEIRRGLALIGGERLFGTTVTRKDAFVPEVLTRSILYLAEARLGALLAFERGISLAAYEESGVKVEARISRELLVSIFTPPLPLHDGGIVIKNGLISAAHCIFPVSNQPELISSGMRHRAAVGLSEETDALVIVVSEERGSVSIAYNGELHRCPPEKAEKMLRRWIAKSMTDQKRPGFSFSEWLASKFEGVSQKLIGRRAGKEA
ncbi:MAG: diadenylate cyclase [Kiritimatiellae bacterium]|nr:diadenylate cyclase [Kiritimatiellia bacterium]